MKNMADEKEKKLMLLKEQIIKSSHDLVLLKEEKDVEITSLQDKVRHLTDSLHLKDQEIVGFMQTLDGLKTTSQNKDVLLKIERKRVEEYLSKMKSLECSMIEKES